MFIFNTLAPIFVLIGVGLLAFHFRFLDQATLRGINRLTYWVALPALLFHGAAVADYTGIGVGRTIAALIAASAVTIAAAALVATQGLKLGGVAAGTFVHVATRANLSFIGLPVLLYIIEARSGEQAALLRSLVLLAMAPYLLVQNAAGILALLIGRHQPGKSMLRPIGKNVITHPVLISLTAGVIVGASGVKLPLFIDRSLHSIAAVAAPAALISIGGALTSISLRAHFRAAGAATLLKIAFMPAVGWLVGTLLGLSRDQMLVVLVFLACPTGAASFSFVAEMGGDQALASATIILSTLAAVIPLTVALLMTV
jgi:malate permease and related proteins